MPKFHTYFQQNSAEWFAIRAGKVTASEICRVITPTGKLCKAETSERYMNRLIAEHILGRPLQDNDYQSEFMELGHENEAATVAAFEFQTDLKTHQVGFVEHDSEPLGCSPDRLIIGGGCLEVKSPSAPVQVSYLLDETELVKKYRLQSQAQIWICEYESGYLCSHCYPLPPVVVKVQKDEVLTAKIAIAVAQFLTEMSEKLLKLERRFGPFKTTRPEVTKRDVFEGMELSEHDLSALAY